MYKAIKSEGYGHAWEEQRDKAAKVMGILIGRDMAPIPAGTAIEGVLHASGSLAEAEFHAKAYCFDHPDKSVYLCDDAYRVHRLVHLNVLTKALGDASEAQGAYQWFANCLTGIFLLNIVAALVTIYFKYDRAALLLLAGVAGPVLLYVGLVRWKIMNEIEGMHIAVILSLLAWPALNFLR